MGPWRAGQGELGSAQQRQLSGRSHGVTPFSELLSAPEGPPK